MAGLARRRRLHVAGVLALGRRAVVAARATRRDAGVVERGTSERRRRLVAGLARRRRLHVAGVLALGRRAVVAARATGSDAGVIERGTRERCR